MNTDIGLTQIFPVAEDGTDNELQVLSASFADPYLLLLRDDQSLFIVKCDENGELEEVEIPEKMTGVQWMSGCLYLDRSGTFGRASGHKEGGLDVKMFLLRSDGALHVSNTAVFKEVLCSLRIDLRRRVSQPAIMCPYRLGLVASVTTD